MKKLQEVILKACLQNEADKQEIKDDEFLKLFLDAKRMPREWRESFDRTILYYKVTIEHLIGKIDTPVRKITTEKMREYLY